MEIERIALHTRRFAILLKFGSPQERDFFVACIPDDVHAMTIPNTRIPVFSAVTVAGQETKLIITVAMRSEKKARKLCESLLNIARPAWEKAREGVSRHGPTEDRRPQNPPAE